MNVFSILTAPSTPIELSENNYHTATNRVYPYVQKKNDKYNTYALCPECKNPIQLINRTNQETQSNTFYAKHAGIDIPDIADHSEENYLDCGLANPQRLDSKSRRKNSVKNNEIKKAIIEYIDIIIYTIENDTQIKLSDSTIRKMIADFALDKGHEYRAINLYNLPYGFAYMTEAQDLYGCQLKDKQSLKAVNDISDAFEVNSYGYIRRKKTTTHKNASHKIRMFFTDHTPHDESHDSDHKESILMNIVEIDVSSGVNVSKNLFTKKLFLNKAKFLNTVNKREHLKDLARKAWE